jgi:fatty acid desaturase
VAISCWTGYVGLLRWHDRLPWPVVVMAFALLGGWYMSIQHEVLHGHPTPWHWVNITLVHAPLSLWLPFATYRESHLMHHAVELTLPGVDPESFYIDQQTWDSASSLHRRLMSANRTFVGRLLIGPSLGPVSVVRGELARTGHDAVVRRRWLGHVALVGVVGWLVFVVADVPVWEYLLGYCYLGMSVTYIRSFAEHRAELDPASRCAVVTSGWFFGIVFLFNNFHHTHHALPSAPWYRLPRLTDEIGASAIAAEGAGLYRGYGELMRRYAFRPLSAPVTPLAEPSALQ